MISKIALPIQDMKFDLISMNTSTKNIDRIKKSKQIKEKPSPMMLLPCQSLGILMKP
jgi:hypothetical protein